MDQRPRQMENVVIEPGFWRDRRVFLTGHTGFKGAWTTLLLQSMGAQVSGFSLQQDDDNAIFVAANVAHDVDHQIGDVRDLSAVKTALAEANPSIVIHMAAQALVRRSYAEPVETYATNVMGTVNLLEAVRHNRGIEAVVIVTSDKVYENLNWPWGYREVDQLGGYDPYSNSKACTELVADSYRRSFFRGEGKPLIASGRAGNVIGGGDWSQDRLIPDAMRAFFSDLPLSDPQSRSGAALAARPRPRSRLSAAGRAPRERWRAFCGDVEFWAERGERGAGRNHCREPRSVLG